MKERPILFSGAMVRAILAGRKTQTRRVIKPHPHDFIHGLKFELHPFAPSTFRGTPAEGIRVAPERKTWVAEDWCQNVIGVFGDCPHGNPGDRLWVRETWRLSNSNDCACYDPCGCKVGSLIYKATSDCADESGPWKPSIFMQRRASRITLDVTQVRAERLQDISVSDCYSEGIDRPAPINLGSDVTRRDNARYAFRNLWDSINAKRGFGWEKNPWVWVIEFRMVK